MLRRLGARDVDVLRLLGHLRENRHAVAEDLDEPALDESVHVVGLSILSGSHLALVRDVMERMRAAELSDIPVVVGGIIPPEDARALKAMGVAGVYTPKDFQINDIMADIVRLVERAPQAA